LEAPPSRWEWNRSNSDGAWEKAGLPIEASPSHLNVVGGFFLGYRKKAYGGGFSAGEQNPISWSEFRRFRHFLGTDSGV
jgi:hypothetical protein